MTETTRRPAQHNLLKRTICVCVRRFPVEFPPRVFHSLGGEGLWTLRGLHYSSHNNTLHCSPSSPPRGIVGRRGGQRWWCWWDEGSGRELRFLSRGWSPGYFLFCAGPVARALPVERSRRGVSTVAAPGKPAILKCYKVAVSPQVSQHAGAPASPSASPGSPSTSPAQRRPATGKNETRSPAVASFTPSPGGYLHY